MYVYEFIAVVLLGVMILLCYLMFANRKKALTPDAERRTNLIATSKAVKKILLNNRWGSIDEKIGILINNSISIDFRLGVKDERTNI